MKIAIFAGSNLLAFHARSLEERPLGGTETAVIRVAQYLQELGHDTYVFTTFENPPPSKPQYLPLKAIEDFGPVDVLISVRDWIPLFYRVQAKQRLFWTGDSYDQFSNYGLGDKRVVQQIDYFLAVSNWQADQICKRSGFPREKVYILRNGIEWAQFQNSLPRQRKRLIYTSTPYRGLEYVPLLYRALYEHHPDLELRVFSSYKIYDQNQDFSDLKKQLENLPGARIFESIKQEELAKEFCQASIWFYPCHFEETSCISAMEAMAAGCVVLSTALGALPETVGDAGILIPGLPRDPQYVKMFLNKADQLLREDALFNEFSQKARMSAKNSDWKNIVQDLDRFLKGIVL